MMYLLWHLIEPILHARETRRIVEIGADKGENTVHLLDYARQTDGHVAVIDPAPKFSIAEFTERYGTAFTMHEDISLNVLPNLNEYDTVLIDGDHNWYNVYHELQCIDEYVARSGTFPLVLLHDCSWPFARRDGYCKPIGIPEDYVRPHSTGGCLPEQAWLSEEPWSFTTNGYNALKEGGPRNGVLTAVEDFIQDNEHNWRFTLVPGFYGLGILVEIHLLQQHPALRQLITTLDAPIWQRHAETLERHRIDQAIEIDRRADKNA